MADEQETAPVEEQESAPAAPPEVTPPAPPAPPAPPVAEPKVAAYRLKNGKSQYNQSLGRYTYEWSDGSFRADDGPNPDTIPKA